MGDATAQEEVPRLVQHVILRKDLTKPPFSWPAGSMIAQGCHVVSKTLWELKEEPNVVAYMADIDNMHKVTLMAKDEEELRAVIEALTENGIHFRSWLEQPEGILTAVATMPYPREVTSAHLKHLKLYR
eukprot:Tamp_24505.p4 GENE.Tamp_24505~~Tamp_24505.p4  ORF type:complete len:129 (+),score=32.72 Tamp_24505:3-389(+)